MPINYSLPMRTGAQCTAGKRVVICTARIASAGLNGRIDTAIGHGMGCFMGSDRGVLHRHVAAARDMTQFDAAAIGASSNEVEQPMTKLARLSRQKSRTSSDTAIRLRSATRTAKIDRQRGRKDGEITLHKTGREPRGRPAMAAPALPAARAPSWRRAVTFVGGVRSGQIARGKCSIRRRLRERRLPISRATYSTK
jgi:hypothetical protein